MLVFLFSQKEELVLFSAPLPNLHVNGSYLDLSQISITVTVGVIVPSQHYDHSFYQEHLKKRNTSGNQIQDSSNLDF